MINILSIPVCGVDIKNDEVEAFDAPCFLRYADTGITPHEQSGKGTPNKDAAATDFNDFFPKYFLIVSTVKKIDRNPQIRKPKSKKGEISLINNQIVPINAISKSKLFFLLYFSKLHDIIF